MISRCPLQQRVSPLGTTRTLPSHRRTAQQVLPRARRQRRPQPRDEPPAAPGARKPRGEDGTGAGCPAAAPRPLAASPGHAAPQRPGPSPREDGKVPFGRGGNRQRPGPREGGREAAPPPRSPGRLTALGEGPRTGPGPHTHHQSRAAPPAEGAARPPAPAPAPPARPLRAHLEVLLEADRQDLGHGGGSGLGLQSEAGPESHLSGVRAARGSGTAMAERASERGEPRRSGSCPHRRKDTAAEGRGLPSPAGTRLNCAGRAEGSRRAA